MRWIGRTRTRYTVEWFLGGRWRTCTFGQRADAEHFAYAQLPADAVATITEMGS